MNDEKRMRVAKWEEREEGRDCAVCGMRRSAGHLNCFLCGVGIRGKPKMLQDSGKLLKFCCDTCSLRYLEMSW